MSPTARWFALATIVLTFIAAHAQNTKQQSFVSGGHLKIKLEAGDYKIQRSADNNIRVTWFSGSVERSQANVIIRTQDKSGDIAIVNTPEHDFHATIEIPAKTDLILRLTAGDLSLTGITGSKDVESRAGDVVIDVGDPNDYSRVDASVLAGDLNAQLLAGDLTLRTGTNATSN